jgi:predicted ATPase
MQIIYCFIEDYFNIVNQGFNFGSPYHFQVEVGEDKLNILKTPNDTYVEGMFLRNSKDRIVNVSAIVGENGTGKTNVLNYIRNCFSGSPFYGKGFVILLDSNNELRIINNSRKEIYSNFSYAKNKQFNNSVIYYSPIYDFNYPSIQYNALNLDVSSNQLIKSDFYEDQFLSESLDMIDFHIFKNISRQVRFITGQKYSRKFTKHLRLPKFVDLIFINPKIGHDKSDLDNVSVDFRPYYEIGVNLWREEIGQIHTDKRKKENVERVRRNFSIDRRYALNGILFNLWKFLFFTQEVNNSTLFEGRVKLSVEEKSELEKLTFEQYLGRFFNAQNIFDGNAILDFITVVKELIRKSQGFQVDESSYVSFELSINDVSAIMRAYSKISLSLTKRILHGNKPPGFMQFSWHDLSSGERAFLDLFSRIYYAKENLEFLVAKDSKLKLPDTIYLLIDEGELGFHLQWQKEYIKTLIDIIPEIFKFQKFHPKIQIIFTTHSPISLSDIPRYNIVYLKKDVTNEFGLVLESETAKQSFGANIHEIMYDAFYLKDGFIGNFAKEIIDELFEWSQRDSKKDLSQLYVRRLIDIIDEPILRIKLEELYAEKFGLNTEEEILNLKIAQMQKRLQQIRPNDKNS